eukprot:COSAG02_NODE_3291_length_6997_cov_7.096260_2_plen_407_part_00
MAFVPYAETPEEYKKEVRVFHDHEFNPDWLEYSFPDLEALCPGIQKVFDDQKLDEEIDWGTDKIAKKDLLQGALWRCSFPTFDGMRFHLWIWGDSTTGKTLIRKVVRKAFFSKGEVSQISNNMQKEFGFEKLVGKNLILWKDIDAPEPGEKFVSASFYRECADGGEEVDVSRKGIRNIDADITAPFLIDANVQWQDVWAKAAKDPKQSLAMARRTMSFEWGTTIETDSGLETQIMQNEIGPWMVLLRKHYDEMVRMAGDKTFGDWDIPLFKATIAQSDTVTSFFQRTEVDGLHCIYEEGAVTTGPELKDAFEEVNGPATFKKIQNKLTAAIAAASQALDDDEEYIYEPAPTGNVYEHVCVNFMCQAVIEDGVQCCDSYGDGPKTNKNKAKKRRVPMKIKNLRIVRP